MAPPATRPRVLCVDDERLVLTAITRSLRDHFDVVTAVNGDDALDLLRRCGPFSVVIADHRMPGMTGVELLTTARAECAEVTRVVLTGLIDDECSRKAHLDADVFHLLQKPWSADELRKVVRSAVERYDEQMAARDAMPGSK